MFGKRLETVEIMKPLSIKSFLPGIAWFFVVLVLICLPSDEIPEPRGWFDWIKLIQFDKMVHSGIFGLLAYLFMRPIAKSYFSQQAKWNYFLKISLAGCIWGLTTELIQKFFVPTRRFDLVDWAADSIGVLLALLFARRVFLKKSKKNQLN